MTEYQPDQRIWVKFGAFGHQKAIVKRVTRSGKYIVEKYIISSKRWTKEVTVEPDRILGYASKVAAEIQRIIA